jgi:hypothetical protein
LTNKDPLMGALMGGLGGYGGQGIGSSLFGAGASTAPAAAATSAQAGATTGTQLGQNIGTQLTNAGANMSDPLVQDLIKQQVNSSVGTIPQQGMFNASTVNPATMATNLPYQNAQIGVPEFIQSSGPNMGQVNPVTPNPGFTVNTAGGYKPFGDIAMENLGQTGRGFSGVMSGDEAALEAFRKGMGAETNLGAFGKSMLPVGGAALGGIEPSDLGYGGPSINELKRQTKYRGPSGQLNLNSNYNQETGEYEVLPPLRLATGGTVGSNQSTISSGGLQDLYGASDNTISGTSLSRDGYGIGRLDKLAQQGSLTKAGDMFYAAGGPVSFADGGDSNKEDEMGLPSLSPDMPMYTNAGADNSAIVQSAMQAMQGMQGNTPMTQGQMPDQSNDSIIAKVTANLMADPNYQPENPIEEAIVNQLKGTDPMQQGQPSQQGLGSLGPAQPSQPMAPSYNPSQAMAPSYNPSVAMGPTYYAGMNAPRGYADGGEVSNYGQNQASLNLDALPSLNLGNGSSGRSEVMQRLISGFGNLGENHADPKFRTIGKFMSGLLSYDPVIIDMIRGGKAPQGYARGGYLNGPGDGLSDSIPATIEGKQPARLADGEFVVSSDVVSALGNGSSKAGAKHLYAMMDRVRQKAHGTKKQINKVNTKQVMPA